MSKEKYEKIYKEHECVFGFFPTPMVKKLTRYLQSGTVMDLGAGEGRNSLFLANKGFDVTALDNAEAGIEKLKKFAAEKRININALVGDARTIEIPKGQDALLAILLFHHLSRKEALTVIEKMKNATREGGFNVLNIITKDSDFYRDDPNTDKFYADVGELKKLYEDWEILEFDSRNWQAFQKRPDGNPIFNTSEEMIARKSSRLGNK